MTRHSKTYPRDNERRLRAVIRALKADLRNSMKMNRQLTEEIQNIIKPVRVRKIQVDERSPGKMTQEEWRLDFIRRFRPKNETSKENKLDKRFIRVVVESPFAGPRPVEIEANITYARLCVKDCLKRSEAPIASHLLYTQPTILDDTNPEERKLGISAGFAWNVMAERVVVYTDRGISNGMKIGIALAEDNGVPVEYRTLEGYSA